MIKASRKELTEAIKWSRKNSPVAYLVFSMNRKWGVPDENPQNIVSSFRKYWPETRDYLSSQALMNFKGNGKLRMVDLEINYPVEKVKAQILTDFFDLTSRMTGYLDRTEEYAYLETYCEDMLSLFVWKDSSADIWKGTEIYALDKQGKEEQAYQMYRDCEGPGEQLAAMYSQALLDRCDTERAGEVLDPFRESTDPDIQDKIRLLDQLKAVKGMR